MLLQRAASQKTYNFTVIKYFNMKIRLISVILLFLLINKNNAQMIYDIDGMTGAKIYFSSQPFTRGHEGAKANFHSGEFIYGRLELQGKTLKEAFQLDNIKKGPYFLKLFVASYKDNQQQGGTNTNTAIRIEENEINNNWLNFDVLPDPAIARSYMGYYNEYESGEAEFTKIRMGPMYEIIEQRMFPANGVYTIYTQFNFPAKDGWGNKLPEKQWPMAEGSFTFSFYSKDVASINNNKKLCWELSKKQIVDKLPDYFIKPLTVSDPSVTVAKVTPVIKNHLGSGYQVLKVAIQPAESMWSIVKNDLGLITQRYVTGYYGIVYKTDTGCKLGSVRILQDYGGNGKYGNLYCKFWGDEGDIDCSKVK